MSTSDSARRPDVDNLLMALIEEARRRARRRRRMYGATVLAFAILAGLAFAVRQGPSSSASGSPAAVGGPNLPVAAAELPPKCSALDTQRHAWLHTGGPYPQSWYARYCGPGRAVLRAGGTSFTIKGGSCSGPRNRRSFGLVGHGGPGKGFWFRLAPVVTTDGRERTFVRPGRVGIIDGKVSLPGFSSVPNYGTAIISKDLKSATFSLGGPSTPRVTGSWTCR